MTVTPHHIRTAVLLASVAGIAAVLAMSPSVDAAGQTRDTQMPILDDLERSKFDSGLLEELTRKMTVHARDTEGASPAHNVVLVVNRTADLVANITSQESMVENKNSLVRKLEGQLGAANVHPARTLSFVTATLPVPDILRTAQLGEVAQVGDGEKTGALGSDSLLQRLGNLDDKIAVNWYPIDWLQNLGIDGDGVKIAVVDSGVVQNADLELPLLRTVTQQVNCIDSDMASPPGCREAAGSKVADGRSHGTRVASIIANQDLTNRGIAHQADIVNVKLVRDMKITNDAGRNGENGNYYRTAEYYHAMDWIVTNLAGGEDPVIINASIDLDECTSSTSTQSRITNEVVDNDVLFVTVTGNRGSIIDPGCTQNVLTVGGLGDGNPYARFLYSPWEGANKGPVLPSTPILKPEIIAPAENVYSLARIDHSDGRQAVYSSVDGTSFAAPYVSGAAALALDANPDYSALELKSVLLLGADWHGPASRGGGYADYTASQYEDQMLADSNASNPLTSWGFGLLDIAQTLKYSINDGPVTTDTILDDSRPAYEIKTYTFDARRGDFVKVIVSWLEHPQGFLISNATGNPSIYSLRIADLDLKVKRPGGTVLATSDSAYQNNEFAVFTAPSSGRYTIEVSAPYVYNADNFDGMDFESIRTQEYALASTHRIREASSANLNAYSVAYSPLHPDPSTRDALTPSGLNGTAARTVSPDCADGDFFERCFVELDGSRSYDPDGDRITEYEWTQVDSTGINATLVNANTESPVFVAPQVTGDKEFEFELRVRDSGTGDFGLADRISVLVQDSDPPVPPVGRTVFSDDFESGLSKWTEEGERDWRADGFDEEGVPGSPAGNRVAKADNCDSECRLVMRDAVDLTAYDSAELSFYRYVDSGLDSGEYLKVDLYDGTGWSTAFDWQGNADDDGTWHMET